MKSGVADERPDAEIMAPIERIARFMETLDFRFLNDAFAERKIVLIENFPPYVFEGGDAVARWAKGFAEHAKNIKGLRHSSATLTTSTGMARLRSYPCPPLGEVRSAPALSPKPAAGPSCS
jgi:hypothetical protein